MMSPNRLKKKSSSFQPIFPVGKKIECLTILPFFTDKGKENCALLLMLMRSVFSTFSFKKKRKKLPFSYNPRGYCLFLYQVNCMWPQNLQQRLYMRPKMKILQSPSIFRCKYHLPSKSPREMRKKDNKHFSNYYIFGVSG